MSLVWWARNAQSPVGPVAPSDSLSVADRTATDVGDWPAAAQAATCRCGMDRRLPALEEWPV